MTQPLKPGRRPGRSEMSHGRGQIPHPDSNYQQPRAGIPGVLGEQGEDHRDVWAHLVAERRSDPTNAQEPIYPDLLYAPGNPDIYGPGLPLVQEKAEHPPAAFKQPVLRYGVDRQE